MFESLLPALLLTAQLLAGVAGSLAASAPVSPTPPPCGPALSVPNTTLPLPAAVSGRVRFYAARYDPQTLATLNAVALGRVNEMQPLASAFKPLVVHGLLKDVDAGRFTLSSLFTTTAANRSIEAFPAGRNSLLTLAKRAISLSDNTAADLLMLAYGPQRLARDVRAQSVCTSVLLTTKAWWTAQAGLATGVLGSDTLAGAQRYAQQGFEDRLETARQLIGASATVDAPTLEHALDVYFHGPTYTQALELALQNTSTVNAYADLLARVLAGERPAPRHPPGLPRDHAHRLLPAEAPRAEDDVLGQQGRQRVAHPESGGVRGNRRRQAAGLRIFQRSEHHHRRRADGTSDSGGGAVDRDQSAHAGSVAGEWGVGRASQTVFCSRMSSHILFPTLAGLDYCGSSLFRLGLGASVGVSLPPGCCSGLPSPLRPRCRLPYSSAPISPRA